MSESPFPWDAELHHMLNEVSARRVSVKLSTASPDEELGGEINAKVPTIPRWEELPAVALKAESMGLIEIDTWRDGWMPPDRYGCKLTTAGRHVLGVWDDAASRALARQFGQEQHS